MIIKTFAGYDNDTIAFKYYDISKYHIVIAGKYNPYNYHFITKGLYNDIILTFCDIDYAKSNTDIILEKREP